VLVCTGMLGNYELHHNVTQPAVSGCCYQLLLAACVLLLCSLFDWDSVFGPNQVNCYWLAQYGVVLG
jgi:hypothetical protein